MLALLIGCGKIGALADLHSPSIFTHAKAMNALNIPFLAFDSDPHVLSTVRSNYSVDVTSEFNSIDFDRFDLIVLATPTSTHFEYLIDLFRKVSCLIICEKPIDCDISRLSTIADGYKSSNCRVLVNCHRSFNPAFVSLSNFISSLSASSTLSSIVINYQRGFHNNCIHALHLLETLFKRDFALSNVSITSSVFDEFPDDPTLSLVANWSGSPVYFNGLAGVKYTYFEINLFFSEHVIQLIHAADSIHIYHVDSSLHSGASGYYSQPILIKSLSGCIHDGIMHTYRHALSMLSDSSMSDNFLASVRLSSHMLGLLSSS